MSPRPSSADAAIAFVVVLTVAVASLLVHGGCNTPSPARATRADAADAAPSIDLSTEAERSGFVRTGRYDEVERLCHGFAARYPGHARCTKIGTTPEGRAMLAIVASADGVLEASTARLRRRPVVLVQGGIHAGEIDGKDGGLWALRELLDGKLAPGALAAVTLVFVPVYNPDGHERFGPNHRPNQRGPEAMGFRTTAQNLNLNRDYMKAEAPETQALLALFEAWDPVVYVDLHATDGAKFQHDVAVMLAPLEPQGDGLDVVAQRLSDALQARLTELGHKPTPFYPSFRTNDDPASGISTEPSSPRFSQPYAAARHRLGILVETHSWASYEQRVRSQHDLIGALLERATTDAAGWRDAADAADALGARLAGKAVALSYKVTDKARTIDFLGYAYEKRPSEISGGTWIVYDESKPEVWKMPFFDDVVADVSVVAPRAGYVVPAAHAAWVAARLRLHGLRFETLATARTGVAAQVFVATKVTFGRSFEGRTPTQLEGSWNPVTQDLAAGSLFVPIDQPRGLLVVHLFEPLGPDSLVSWGYVNAAFERKEYMEGYVAEAEARKMLAADPTLRGQFDAALADPAFAANPQARLDFFYRRHPAWDARLNVVPFLRVDVAPPGDAPLR